MRRGWAPRVVFAGLLAAAGAGADDGRLMVHGQERPTSVRHGQFSVAFDDRGLTRLSATADPTGADVLAPGSRLGVMAKYRVEQGDWLDLYQTSPVVARPSADEVSYTNDVDGTVLASVQRFTTDGTTLDWTLDVANRMPFPVEVGDLAFAIPWRAPGGEDPETIFERSWTKHQFVSGQGSFLYVVRPSGAPPYLLVTARPGTSLEYTTSAGGRGTGFLLYAHSARTGGAETRGTWRQPHTSATLGPSGTPEGARQYGLRFRWASSYDEMRQLLYEDGLFDVRVVPGMTVPEDLDVRIALHTKARIEAVIAEYQADTTITPLPSPRAEYQLYAVTFRHLGENRLTVLHDGRRQTHLEFFVTEPLETLIKKRAQFLVRRQQHRVPNKWYDGLFSVYDMRAKTLRSPDDTDGFDYWWSYVVAADDPVLGKAPFIASKNVRFPVQEELDALEYYVRRFVWGKLQRTSDEQPYPWGLHGVPNWIEARDTRLRARSSNANLDKMKIWRSYDYPHMVMLYFHLYEIARTYPSMVHDLDAAGYLERAYQTARAYFTYPYEILPWYETYKWGCYNELVILDLIAALDREGRTTDAAWLRGEWEKKVKYFVYDDPYPFRSEYAIDRTAFESSYALAKYGATHDMAPDTNLWFDKNKNRWYSHPTVSRADSRAFMDRQLRAGLAVRGWLEPAYYLLGSDFTGSSDTGALSYMAQMGGWGILDYGLTFAPQPWDWIQLGYASYLSAWALMNTGRADTNYGFWAPGPENDGASGWQFMTAKFGRGWIRKDMPRGPWHYDGEIDLGYGGALRAATAVLADDPTFGLVAYGGTLTTTPAVASVVPRDGLRQRFAAVLPASAVKGAGCDSDRPCTFRMEFARDGFAAEQPINVERTLKSVSFFVENRTNDAHATTVRLSFPGTSTWEARVNGRPIPLQRAATTDYPWTLAVAVPAAAKAPLRVELRRR